MKKREQKHTWIVWSLLFVLVLGAVGVGFYSSKGDKADPQKEALERLESLHGEYDPGRIVLSDTTKSKAEEIAKELGAELRMNKRENYAVLTLPEETSIEEVYKNDKYKAYVSEMDADNYVSLATVTPVASAPTYTANDAHYSSQNYLNYINVGSTWNQTDGSGVKVAIIDTGIDTDHPEFSGRISNLSYNATEDKRVVDQNDDWSLIEDEQGHGTAVAGALAATANNEDGIVGIAPGVELIVIKAECDKEGNFARASDLVMGIYYAIECDVDVINMSFGSTFNAFQGAVDLAYDSDIICVAAAGNDATALPFYPAASENTIGVGALEADGWELASYSNFGEDNVDIVAPGSTYTTTLGNDYKNENGTSLAAPIVSGAVALYRAMNQNAEFSEVQEMLYASSVDLGDAGPDWTYGYGALDIDALVCQEKGTVTFEMLTDEIEPIKRYFVRGHALQNIPEPERSYAVFMGWFFSEECEDEDALEVYETIFTKDLTVYAGWDNEDDGVPFTYVELSDGTIEIRSYTGHRRYITIPDSIDGKMVTSIGEGAFAGDGRLREINLPENLLNIRDRAFMRCTALVKMEIPRSVTNIGANAYQDCARLRTITFDKSSNLTTIGNRAFAGSALDAFEVPAKVTKIDGTMFFGCQNLSALTVASGSRSFSTDGTALMDLSGKTLLVFPAGYAKDYTIPEKVKTIGTEAFAYARLTGVNLGNVVEIGKGAFAYSKLKEAELTDSVTILGEEAFAYCSNLSKVTLGDSLNIIGSKSFLYDANLKKIV